MINEFAPSIRSQGLNLLEHMLAAGWLIESPVIVRQSWGSTKRAYHFVLYRVQQRSLVVITDAPDLQRFLQQHQLTLG